MAVYGDLGTAISIGVLRQAIGFTLTVGMWFLYQRWAGESFSYQRHGWRIALVCAVATAIDIVVADVVREATKLDTPPEVIQRGVIFLRFSIYMVWSALYFAIRRELEARDTELKLARLESAHHEAELQLLRAQMNPHFLFNALNSIIGHADKDPEAVIETTHAVADYLRYSLSSGSHRAPLGNELDAMTNYLRVLQSQYGTNRFEWRIEASVDARKAYAPTAFVQPLVENAFKYGIETSPPPLRLNVQANVGEGHLVVVVENTGKWIDRRPGDARPKSTGIGLNNLRRRLSLLCGENARMQIAPEPGVVRIEVRLPFETAPAPAVL